MKVIVCKFILDIEKNQQAAGNPRSEASDIDHRKPPLF
jgi:hypothetical protein